MKITFLGTGTSHGVPSIDCMIKGPSSCPKGVCVESKKDHKHRRSRSSILISDSGKNILIDASADFREQALREEITSIDALLLTHSHADHITGLPDIRSYTPPSEAPLPLFCSEETAVNIRRTFGYMFDPNTFIGGGIPRLTLNTVRESFTLYGKTITPIPVLHGSLRGCFGYRVDNLAYIPDVKMIGDSEMELLQNLDCLIIDALRESRPHSTHLILPESIKIAQELKPKRTLFTHMSHDIHYKKDAATLDSSMDFAWDGLQIEI